MTGEEVERMAARRLSEAQNELKTAMTTSDVARIVAASLQLTYARNDLRRAVAAAASAAPRSRKGAA